MNWVGGRTQFHSRKGGGLCERCVLYAVARRTVGVKNLHKLKEIFDKQHGICAYTGRTITIGVDAELDHKIPVSKGGTHDIENLQWIYYAANIMKHSLLEEEFLDLVSVIFKHKSL